MPNEGQRIRALESIEFANLLPVAANPNGSLDSSQGVFAWDATSKNLYINTDGATAWTLVWLGSGGASPLTTKGDLFGFDTADARIPVGADDEILTADSSTALGVSWQAAFSSPLSTKGDLFGFDSADARIPIGADGFVLTADSAQALGLKWAAGFSSPLTTKGDLFGFSTIDARIPVGTNDQVLKADSGAALGVSWQAVAPLTTKGDLFGFDTGDARIPIGANDQVLTADSTQVLGLKWSDVFSSPLTTKGDLLVYTTVDARLPVGTDEQRLEADSAQTAGMKWADKGFASGTYTPTLTNQTNITASTVYTCQYLQVGNIVNVSGKVDIDPTAASSTTRLGISLPIASNIAFQNDAGGVGASVGGVAEVVALFGDVANNRVTLRYQTGTLANHAVYFTFQYIVK